jgi:hypothetical protein
MPGLNQTGPMGKGSMTGRKMGKCCNFGMGKNNSSNEITPENQELNENGRGLGGGQGGGRMKGQGNGQGNRRGMRNGNQNNN